MSRFGPEYWDKHGTYRAPLGFTLTLVVLLRAYLFWVFAAVSRQPELDLMSLVYRRKEDFFVALAIGSIALIPAILYSLRRPGAAQFLGRIWRGMRWPLILCAALDLGWGLWQAGVSHYRFSYYLGVQLVLLSWVLLYLVRSRYLSVFFSDWPEPHETDKEK